MDAQAVEGLDAVVGVDRTEGEEAPDRAHVLLRPLTGLGPLFLGDARGEAVDPGPDGAVEGRAEELREHLALEHHVPVEIEDPPPAGVRVHTVTRTSCTSRVTPGC
jgi:hypothetical protein